MMHIPAPALQALERLHKADFAAFVVGGCVRDSLLGNTPGDWDITTAARPEQVHRALSARERNTTVLRLLQCALHPDNVRGFRVASA